MIIEKVKYWKDDNNNNASVNATIDGVNYSVPMDEDNTHYQEILKWVEEGNTIEEAD
tara:strand:+ start:599 stop:769 length:171 start_codon:yes stop_codon:yes gene_type:complete